MATANKFNAFVELLAEKGLNLGSDQLTIALTNTIPTSGMDFQNDLTEISYTNCSSRNVTTSSSSQTSGTYKLVCADLVLTASGTVGPFQYYVVYDSTPGTSATNPLILWWDHGSAVTLASGQTFTIDFSAANGVLQLV